MPLDVKAAILCDFVRIEETGKHIIIGVYTGSIVFPALPTKFTPTFWIEMVPFTRDSDMDLELKLEVPGLKKPRIGPVRLHIQGQGELVHLTLTGPPIEITETGLFRVSMRPLGRGRWQEVIAKAVQLRQSSPPAS
jgi:hypothetical protein